MKRIFTLLVLTFLLTGCATVKGWVPSFWDDNQSYAIIDVRLQVEKLDCSKPQLPQVQPIAEKLRWFEMYSESKGWQQADVLRLTTPMKESVADFVKRSEEKQGSETYCEIKKKMLQTQAATAAKAVLGRF
jgi:hypothetical protein